MKRNNQTKYIYGQTILEVAILFVVVTLALVAVSRYVKRSISGRLREAAGEISSTLYNPAGKTQINTTRYLTQNSWVNSIWITDDNLVAGYLPPELDPDKYDVNVVSIKGVDSANTTGNETVYLQP